MFVTCIIVLLVLLLTVNAYFKYSFLYWKKKGVPYEEPSFPWGNLRGLGTTQELYEILKMTYDKYKQSGAKFCGMYFLSHPVIVLLDLQLIKSVFITDFTNFDERGIFYNENDEPMSAHMITLNGEKWRKLRSKFTPAFASGKMKFMFSTIVEVGERFRANLSEKTRLNNELDMKDLCARFTMDIIGSCVFGIECNSMNSESAAFKHYGLQAMKRMHTLMYRYIIFSVFERLVKLLQLKTTSSEITEFFTKVVRETVDYREINNISRNDFMDIMIKLKNTKLNEDAITFNELAAQAYIFFLAGFDTSSTTLNYSLFELAKHPEIQIKARRLVQDAYKKYDRQYTYEMMVELQYIEQIISETLRKHTPITFTPRKANNDYKIPGTNTVIEKGTMFLIPIHAVHYDPEYYPNPDNFDPDRFTCEEKNKRDAMTWIPFGDGPRNCIGMRFGMMQTQIGLIILLNNFEFSIKPGAVTIEKSFISLPAQITVTPLKKM